MGAVAKRFVRAGRGALQGGCDPHQALPRVVGGTGDVVPAELQWVVSG